MNEDGDEGLKAGNVGMRLRLDFGEGRAGGSRRRRSGGTGSSAALDNVDGLLSDVGCGGEITKVSTIAVRKRERAWERTTY